MKTYNFTQLLCTSILSALVGMVMVFTALTVKPHTATTAATVRAAAHVASISHVKASIILEVPTVANIEVIPATTEAKTTEAAKVVTSSEVNNSLSDVEIQKAKDYCLKHMVKAEFVELETQDPPILIAAR